MKNFVLILLTLIVNIYYCNAQEASLSISGENIIYQELPSNVKIVVEGRKCGDFKVSINNGTIIGTGCNYKITAKNIGVCDVTIYYVNNYDTILLETKRLRVKNVPPPIADIANKQKGFIKLETLVNQKYIMCKIDTFYNFNYDYKYLAKEFNFIIERDGNQIFQEKVKGYKFTNSILEAFKTLKKGDKIFVKDIIASGFNIEISDINDIELVIN